MPYLRRRPMIRRRRKAKWMWIRSNEQNLSPASPGPNLNSLTAAFRTTQGGLLLELPDLVVWRIHIKISIRFRYSSTAFSANEGVFCGIAVDSHAQLTLSDMSFLANPYSEQYLMWDVLFCHDQNTQDTGGLTFTSTLDNFLYRSYDIKAHRRFRNVDDDLLLQLTAIGNITLQDYSFVQSTLVRVPG